MPMGGEMQLEDTVGLEIQMLKNQDQFSHHHCRASGVCSTAMVRAFALADCSPISTEPFWSVGILGKMRRIAVS
jgi:hypothetical protein